MGERGEGLLTESLVDAIPYHAMPLSHKHMTNTALIIFYERGCAGGSQGWRGEGSGDQQAAPSAQRRGLCGKVSSGTSLGQRAFDLRTAITPASK